jgi:hypothetical protein
MVSSELRFYVGIVKFVLKALRGKQTPEVIHGP